MVDTRAQLEWIEKSTISQEILLQEAKGYAFEGRQDAIINIGTTGDGWSRVEDLQHELSEMASQVEITKFIACVAGRTNALTDRVPPTMWSFSGSGNLQTMARQNPGGGNLGTSPTMLKSVRISKKVETRV